MAHRTRAGRRQRGQSAASGREWVGGRFAPPFFVTDTEGNPLETADEKIVDLREQETASALTIVKMLREDVGSLVTN